MSEKGLRYNSGKVRMDLLEPYAIEQLAKVFTKGAEKYAPHNWLKGLPWMSVVASLKRHLSQFEQGEDFDEETGLYHMAHVAWNAMALVSYYKHRPEFDDRMHKYLSMKKIGLDVDDVCAVWASAWAEKFDHAVPTAWQFDRSIMEKFDNMKNQNELDEFFLGLKPNIDPLSIPFEPHCYVTSRPVDTSITERWLDENGFPAAPVYTVGLNGDKIDILKESGVEIFVDDRYENFRDINNAGICCYLFDAPHNRRYNVGYKRIYSLNELI